MAVLLFEHGMDPNRPNWVRRTPLHHFAEHGDLESAALFIEHGADINAREEDYCSTPLALAAKSGQIRMVEFLLRQGAKPILPDDPPWATPLQWATRRGHDAIVRLMSEYERTGGLPVHNLEYFETLVHDLVEAYRSGNNEAFRSILDLFQIERQLTWDRPAQPERIARLRRFVRERLGRRSDDDSESESLALADARLLVARSHGFESWEHLMKNTQG
jgi:hypothetical protein